MKLYPRPVLSGAVLISPLFLALFLCYPLCRYEVHRHEANYQRVYHLDYEHVDYFRFGRVEKQLESYKKFSNPPPEANLAVGFFF